MPEQDIHITLLNLRYLYANASDTLRNKLAFMNNFTQSKDEETLKFSPTHIDNLQLDLGPQDTELIQKAFIPLKHQDMKDFPIEYQAELGNIRNMYEQASHELKARLNSLNQYWKDKDIKMLDFSQKYVEDLKQNLNTQDISLIDMTFKPKADIHIKIGRLRSLNEAAELQGVKKIQIKLNFLQNIWYKKDSEIQIFTQPA